MQNVEKGILLLHVHACLVCKETPTLSANQSALSTLSVLTTWPVFSRNAKIPVLEFVDRMPIVEFKIIIPPVFVIQDTMEIHSHLVEEQQHHLLLQDLKIPVFQLRVAQMPGAVSEMAQLLVNAFLSTLVTHMLHADLSVLSTLIVLQTKLVRGTSVLIHALELVESMHNVM